MAKKSNITASKNLLIVESPAKARTLSKFLGKNFVVKASLGHVRDLSKDKQTQGLGIDIKDGFRPHYEIIVGKEKIIQELQQAAGKAEKVYLAPDPDREGEAIAWHIQELLAIAPEKSYRVTYNAITEKAVQEALKKPRQIDMNLVHAQQSRRILDRLVGFKLSPFLWQKVAKNLSAGRVQSVAVRLLVEREQSIRAFVPQTYWTIHSLLKEKDNVMKAQLVSWKDEAFKLGSPQASDAQQVEDIALQLRDAKYSIVDIASKEQQRRASPPFITSTLQQAASNAYSFSPSRTMRLAQQLYEGVELGDLGHVGLITYMRSDSVRVEPTALQEVRSYIGKHYAQDFLPEKAIQYGSKGGSQDAHEAIRPSFVNYTPEQLSSYLADDLLKLYRLIWQRFVASQMSAARYENTTVFIEAASGIFELKGRVTLFPGYTVLAQHDKSSDQILPVLKKGQILELDELLVEEQQTKPPNRYSEAGLVKALEKEGIGRPSTYAPIISTIQERGYASLHKRAFQATELGIAVTHLLLQHFPNILDFHFTADMESQLDQVEEGHSNWLQLMQKFYGPFEEQLEEAIRSAKSLNGSRYEGKERCPLCSAPLVVRYSQRGAFLSCSTYPECRGSLSLPGEEQEANEEKKNCPQCGRLMLLKTSRYGKKFYACSGYPECRTTESYFESSQAPPDIKRMCDLCGAEMSLKQGSNGFYLACSRQEECQFSLPLAKNGEPIPLIDKNLSCRQCGKMMQAKMGPRGAFLACTGYPECKSTLPLDKEGRAVHLPNVEATCEKCGKPMQVKLGRRGAFLACTGFPKCRNAQPLKQEGEERAEATKKKTASKKKSVAKKTTSTQRKTTNKKKASTE